MKTTESPSLLSIETGLEVFNVVNVRSQPGAAGTILNNLVALGVGEILDAGIGITAADMGNIQLLDDAGKLRIVAHRGFNAPFLESFDEVPVYCQSTRLV